MKIAIVHYHLIPGGVTTVIRHQVEALKKTGSETVVITGTPSPTPFPAETVVVEGLGYTQDTESRDSIEKITGRITSTIKRRWPGGCDIIHCHNPTLAKNINVSRILEALQKKGERLFLQIHDFAEDGRPGSYIQAPYLQNCHYGVINSRDYRVLLKAGLKKEGLHLLPNMVVPIKRLLKTPSEKPFVLYPVRAIRRKNIGEALLLSMYFETGCYLAVTLPPNSNTDMIAYKDWRSFAKQHRLPVRFGVGRDLEFPKLVADSDRLITTSITEGFGFSFLEPWTAGKFLQGRCLPDICTDFEENGLELGHLYQQLQIPLDWINTAEYYMSRRSAMYDALRKFNHHPDPSFLSELEPDPAQNATIDFGLLNEKHQKTVLHRLITNPSEKNYLKEVNPFLAGMEKPGNFNRRIRHNREIVLEYYNDEAYQKTLQKTYESVRNRDVFHEIQKDVLLSQFVRPEGFSLLKWGDYER